MKCPKCGNVLSDSAKFCPKCGIKMEAAGDPARGGGRRAPQAGQPARQQPGPSGRAPQAGQPVRQQPGPSGRPPQSGQPVRQQPGPSGQPVRQPQYSQAPRKRSKVPVIIAVIAAVLVISGAAVGATLFFVNKGKKSGGGSADDVWAVTEEYGEQRETRKAAEETPRADRETSAAIPPTDSTTAGSTAPAQPAVTETQTQPVAAETPAGVEGYILQDSSIRYLTDQDLVGLSTDQLRLARNEIYARHGRKFKDEQLQAYFNSQPWYRGTLEPDSFNEAALLNEVERKNLELIKAREAVLN